MCDAVTDGAVEQIPSAVQLSVQGILFDMDGVLVGSTVGDERCWTRWAERHRLVGFDLHGTHGRRAVDTVRQYFPHATELEMRNHILDLELLAAEELSGVSAYRGVLELLAALPADRWTVVTSASEALMRSRLASVGITAPVRVVAGDSVSKGKPDPEGYRRGAALLSRRPEECLVIEDAPAGIRAGKSAGCLVLAIASSHLPEKLGEADWVVGSFDQIVVSIGESGALDLQFPGLVRT